MWWQRQQTLASGNCICESGENSAQKKIKVVQNSRKMNSEAIEISKRFHNCSQYFSPLCLKILSVSIRVFLMSETLYHSFFFGCFMLVITTAVLQCTKKHNEEVITSSNSLK